MSKDGKDFALQCPIPIKDYPYVLLAHGGGGKLMHQLIEKMFLPAFQNSLLDAQHDSAIICKGDTRLAFTTDSFVVKPLFFPGGDIGSLSVHGTINDLAMSGARPLCLSAAFILEEGFPMETLWRVTQSMKEAARQIDVSIVTGDTKVVDKGKGDGIYINTTGIGVLEHALTIHPRSVHPGDAILVNGDLGRHGMAIMAVREGLSFEGPIESDSAAVWPLVAKLLAGGIRIHCLRDLTRGGLGNSLVEIARGAKVSMQIDEKSLPVQEAVRGACEILGLDPSYVANEGRFAAIVDGRDEKRALQVMRSHPLGEGAVAIGMVGEGKPGLVTVQSSIGTSRILDMLPGEQLPRIC